MVTGFRRSLAGIIAAAFVLSVSACGGEDPSGKLSLNVTFPPSWESQFDMSVLGAPAGTAYIGTVRTMVDCGGGPGTWDSQWSSGGISFGKLELGGGCDITVRAVTAGAVIMENTLQSVSLPGGAVTSLDLQLNKSGGFDYAGSLSWPRMYHSAVPVGNDEVLVLGGAVPTDSTKDIEKVIYSGQGTTTASFGCSLNDYRTRQKALYDPVSRRAFVFLGSDSENNDDKFEVIDVGAVSCQSFSLVNFRKNFSPTIFNQTVFLVGGYNSINQWYINSEKISTDPVSQEGPSVIGIFSGRKGFQCFESGKYSACMGGSDGFSFFGNIDAFDLSVEASKSILNFSEGKIDFAVTSLSEGLLMVSGGAGGAGLIKDVEMVNLITNTVDTFTDVLISARSRHTATLLANGEVLIVGGITPQGVAKSAEIFDPVTHTSRELPWRMSVPRSGHTATLLSDGRVLIIGGNPTDTSMEIFNPAGQ